VYAAVLSNNIVSQIFISFENVMRASTSFELLLNSNEKLEKFIGIQKKLKARRSSYNPFKAYENFTYDIIA